VGRISLKTLQGKADASSRELALDRMLEGAGHEHDMASHDVEMLPNWHPLALLFGYLPLLLTLGIAGIVAKGIIWLTALLIGPFVALLWRTRRSLADATAIQLTRYPDALAVALRDLASGDVTVPGAAPVHFLFPIWDPAVDRGARAGSHDAEAMPGSAAITLREFSSALGWLSVAILFLGGVLAVSALAAAAVLYLLGWLLHILLVAIPRWITGLWA
jgi:hypothetical protein